MKFAVCSLAIGSEYKNQVELCTKSQEMHSNKHGYDRITDESIYDPTRATMWSKIPLIKKYLPDYDYIMWIDGDVLITNQERKIEDFIALMAPETMILLAQDFQGLNNGVFIIKNCPLALEFLDDVYAKKEYSHVLFHEQSAMDDLRKLPKYSGAVKVIPHQHINILNAYDFRVDQHVHWKPGDFCVHFAGLHDPVIRMNLQNMYWRFMSTDPAGTQRIENYRRS
jgi:hypothetical protein